MTVAVAPKTLVYLVVGAGALVAAIMTGQPGLAGLGVPFLAAIAVGLMRAPAPLPEVSGILDPERVTEGDTARLTVAVVGGRPGAAAVTAPVNTAGAARPGDQPRSIRGAAGSRCELVLQIPDGLRAEGPSSWEVRLDDPTPESCGVDLAVLRHGTYRLGPVVACTSGPFGLIVRRGEVGPVFELRARPQAEAVRTPVRALAVRATVGDRLARRAGDGIEFADVAAYAPGMGGRVNWRATERRGATYVTLREPERSTDVTLLVDTFSRAPLTRQVRAASGLASMYLAAHDRVALVSFGGVLHWVEPAMGRAQLERIVTALSETTWYHSYAWKSAEIIPPRVLRATGLVIACSPLEDPRAVNALAAIRSRGLDLAILETVVDRRLAEPGPAGEVARTILAMERADLREDFARRGVPVVTWEEGAPLEGAMAALAASRRRVRQRPTRRR